MIKTQTTEKERKLFSRIGRIGGQATFAKIGKKGMRERGRAGGKARWAKYYKAKNRKKPVDN